MESTRDISELVAGCARQANEAASLLGAATDESLDSVLRNMSAELVANSDEILEANKLDVEAASSQGMAKAMIDRLVLDDSRLAQIGEQLEILAGSPFPPLTRELRRLDGDLVLQERRRPVGVIGANYEARPNVTIDIASQLIKSRNAGVLRTGSAALRSSAALIDRVVSPALVAGGLSPDSVVLIRDPDRSAARELVSQSGLVPLVILRGSGQSTQLLADEASRHGVRTLAHADGGGVLYIDSKADTRSALALVRSSLDRLGVCNRLNLLLVHNELWGDLQAPLLGVLESVGVVADMPPHSNSLGHEWALDDGNEATVTIDFVNGPAEAASIANAETSGLAAGIATQDTEAWNIFLSTYKGTGAFWNAPTRLLDGFKMFALPETGINLDNVPGPRGPVTFHDLYIRQLVVQPLNHS